MSVTTIPLLLIVFIPGLFFAVMFAMSRISGWPLMAKRWPAQPVEPNATRGVTSVLFPPIWGYKNCVVYAVDDHHLHMRMMLFVSMFHPPMSIPWSEVSRIDANTGPFKMLNRLHIGPEHTIIYVRSGLVRRELEIRRMIEENERAAVEQETA